MMPTPAPIKRLNYLDVIKVLCLGFVFFFHCFKIFDAKEWHIKNNELLQFDANSLYVLGMAVMPMFFVISGGSIWISLQKRPALIFLQNIFKRFFFPLLFGLTLLAIPQVYFERVNHGEFSGTIIDFLPHYFTGLHGMGGNFAWTGLHLWFLIMLFFYSILLLPFFMVGKNILQKPFFQKTLHHPFVLILFAIIIAAPGYKLHPNGWMGAMWGGWNIFQDLLFFALGFVLFSNTRFIETCKKYKWISLSIAILLTALSLYWYSGNKVTDFRTPFYMFRLFVKGVACWAWIASVLGIAAQHFNSDNSFTKYWSRAALPFYILSQPVIIIIGFYVVQWPLGIWAKFTLVTVASFAITVLIYEGIKKVSLLRWAFGIPEKKAVSRINQKLGSSKNVIKSFWVKKSNPKAAKPAT